MIKIKYLGKDLEFKTFHEYNEWNQKRKDSDSYKIIAYLFSATFILIVLYTIIALCILI